MFNNKQMHQKQRRKGRRIIERIHCEFCVWFLNKLKCGGVMHITVKCNSTKISLKQPLMCLFSGFCLAMGRCHLYLIIY
jgi:hypothetical protein